MKNKLFFIVMAIAALTAASFRLDAAPPNPVLSVYTYQGAIFVDDVPFDGTGLFKLAIVNGSGQTVWSNDGTSVDGSEPAGDIAAAIDRGVFVIPLGDDTIPGMLEIDPAIFATDETLYLKTWFDDGANGFEEMVPPIRLTASSFAINAQFLRGFGPDDFFLNSGQIVSSQIAAGAVQAVNIAGGAVGSSQIAAGAVTDDKIAAFSDARTFNVGDASGNNVQIVASVGAANNPALRYDTAGSKWQYSNDGLIWQDIGSGAGSGTVNSGTQNRLAYYAATGDAVSELGNNMANGVLVTSAASVPSIASVLPSAVQDNITRVGIVGTGVWQGTAIADLYVANDLTINGGTVDDSVIGGTTAADATVRDLIAELDAVIEGGNLTVGTATESYAGRVILHDADAGDAFTTTIRSHNDVDASFTLALPADGGSAGQVLITDGNAPVAQLGWTTAATGDVAGPPSSTSNALARFSGTGGKTLQNSGVVIGDTNDVTGIAALSIDSMGKDWTNAGRTVADLGEITTVDINGGMIDGVNIGGATAGEGTFLDLVASTFLLGTINQGDILYDNGTSIVRLTPGVDGQFLQTKGADADPVWASPAAAAPVDATYITQTPDATLTNEQALSSLGTGLMRVTTGTGLVSSVTTSAGIANLIGDETGSGALVFGSSPTLTAPLVNTSLTMQNASWLGLGAGAGRIQFVDDATDKINFLQANVGILKSDPLYPLDVTGTARATTGILAGYGTAAAPAYRFDTDTDTGMYRAAADNLAFATGGAERMRIDAAGRVGIGTSTFDPIFPERFVVDAGVTPSVNVMTAYGEIDNQLRLNIRNRSAGTNAGTAFAASADNSDFSHFAAMGVTSSGYGDPLYTMVGPNDGFFFVIGGDVTVGTASPSTHIKFHTAGTLAANERARITADGRLGVGTTVPAAKLEVEVSDGDTVPGMLIDNNDVTNKTSGLRIDVEAGQGIPLILSPRSSPPSVTAEGGLYANATDNRLYYHTGSAWVDLTAGGGGAAPVDATYITQTPDATLTNEQALSSLGTGLMQVTTGTGVVASVTDSAGIAGLISDETGTGALVFGTSPALDGTTAITGTPTAAGATWVNLGSVTTIDINGGTIDGAAIGGATPAAGAFTTLSSSGQYTNTVAYGTTPMVIASTTLVSNLNVDYLDDQSGSYYLDLVNATIAGEAQGDVLYFDGTSWARLAAGSSGEFLQTQGSGANPVWASPPGGGTVNAGTANQVAYYATSTNAVSGTFTLPNEVQGNITQTGTIAAGAWNGTAIGETYGGTGRTTYTVGDILYSNVANTLSVLGIGTVNQVLTVSAGGLPVWSDAAGGGADTHLSNLTDTVAINKSLLPGADNSIDLGSSDKSWKDAHIDGTATIASVDIDGGTIDGASVGGTTPAAGSFLDLRTGADGTDGKLTLYSEQGGTDYLVVFQPNNAMTQDTTYILPPDDGASGEFLQTDGSGALIWASPAGSGTVNNGTINQLAYYAATGDAVSGLATANDGVLVTSGAGVPSISSTLPTAVQGNITQVGTISSGAWGGTAIDETHGGTNQTAYAAGDILHASAADTLTRLAIGNVADVLTVSGGVPAWATPDFANKALSNLASVAVNTDLIPDTDGSWDLGTDILSWADAWFDGTVTIATADINGGNIDGTAIGATTPAAGAFTTLTTNAQAAVTLMPYGTGAGQTGEIRFGELVANGGEYVGFRAPGSIGTNTIWRLPSADGTSGQALLTDGSGNLSWSSVGAGTITAVGSMTSGAAFADASANNQWLGLGAGAGRIAFLDQAIDKINFLQANVGIMTSDPGYPLDVTGTARATTGILAGYGSAAAPAYRFDTDTDTGMYRAATDNLGLVTRGEERLRLDEDGHVGIGATTFDTTHPERLLVDNIDHPSINIISARGNLNNYLQLNIQNRNGGGNASSDIVATADTGDEDTHYINMGINSSGYNNPDYSIGGPLDGYMYVEGGHLSVGTATTDKGIRFHTAGTEDTDERARITADGRLGVGTTSPAAKLEVEVSDGDNVAGIVIDNNDVTGDTAGLQIDMEAGAGIPLIISPLGSAPAVTVAGGLYADATTNRLYYYTGSAWVDLTSGGGGGAPAGASYITKTPDATLTNEQALSLLGTGLMRVTTGTGLVSSVTTSAGIAGLISDETGSGALVFGTSPTVASPSITTSPTAAGATWANLGSVTTIDINGGTIDGAAIGGATPAAGTFTNLTANTTLIAPNAASPSVTAAGQIAVDTDDARIAFHDGTAARTVTALKTKCATVEDISSTDDDVPLFVFHKPSTMVQTACYTSGAAFVTAPAYQLKDGDGNVVTGAATCGTSPAYVDTTTGNTFAANEGLKFDVTNNPSPTADTWTTICFVYREDA